MTARAAVILAAGQGTRMKSATPKVLHKVGGRTMLDIAIDTAEAAGCEKVVAVVGAQNPAVREQALARLGQDGVAVQDPPLGTGHAVLAAKPALAGFTGDLLVLNADCPLLTADDLAPLFDLRAKGIDLALLGFHAHDPGLYGRMVIGLEGEVLRIVEARDASPDVLKIDAVYAGIMAADARKLFGWLGRVGNDNAKQEYYLTDVVGLANADDAIVHAAFAAETSVMGADSQALVAAAEGHFQARRRQALLASGVGMTAPETVFFAWDTQVSPGAAIEPYVVFGPGVTVESGAVIRAFSHLEGATVAAGAIIGPYARLRPGSEVGEAAHVGNFVELKAVKLGRGAKANHLSYLGDGEVGAAANIGAGTIFCNYDGFLKHRTVVGEGAFIGSNTALVAPVTVGAGAYIGSGSVVSRDVAADALMLTRAPAVEKPGWAARFRERMKALKAAKR